MKPTPQPMHDSGARRRLIAALAALPAVAGALPLSARAAQPRSAPPGLPDYPVVRRGVPLAFPRDFGAHPEYRTEWWYITGWLQARTGTGAGGTGAGGTGAGGTGAGGTGATAAPMGFQVTFFRSRPQVDTRNPSRFAARELVLAHVALSDERQRTLAHDQRTARAGFGLAGSSTTDTDVWIDDWRLSRRMAGAGAGDRAADAATGAGSASRYIASIPGNRLGFELQLESTQPLLLHGDAGFSQKGPLARQASYYYTQPHLAVSGRVVHDSKPIEVTGRAWLDHEWSSEIMAAGATGWDWIGINLDDGGALMAFRIRNRDGTTVHAGGTWRSGGDGGNGTRLQRTFGPRSVVFEPQRTWRSARTGASWPVAMRVTVGTGTADALTIDLEPMFDDQELDARTSTGIVYWEGAVTARTNGRILGRGYLELTGYHGPVVL